MLPNIGASQRENFSDRIIELTVRATPALVTTCTRSQSSVVAVVPWAKVQRNVRRWPLVAGSVNSGDVAQPEAHQVHVMDAVLGQPIARKVLARRE